MSDVEASTANGTQTTEMNGTMDATHNNGTSDSPKTTSSNRLPDGAVTGLFAMYKNHKNNRANNGVVKAPKTVEVTSSSGTTIIQETTSKQAITDDKSVNNIFTPPTQESNTSTQLLPSTSSDDIPSPGFVSRFQAKKQQMIRWPLKLPTDSNSAMPKSVFQTETAETAKLDSASSTPSPNQSPASPSTSSSLSSSPDTASPSTGTEAPKLRKFAVRKQQIQQRAALSKPTTESSDVSATTPDASATPSTSSQDRQQLLQELSNSIAHQQQMWKDNKFMQSSSTPATKGQAPSIEATQSNQNGVLNTTNAKPPRPADGPVVPIYDEDNAEEAEDDFPMEDERTLVRNTLQSYKERALELANQKEALLGAALQLQDIIEKAQAENEVLKDQLTEVRQQRISAMNAMTELRQRIRTLDNLLVEQTQEIDGLKWNLHNMSQQLEVSTKEKDQLIFKAKQMEAAINESMPAKQILELRTQLDREKLLRAKMELYAKKLEAQSTQERRQSSSYVLKETVQLLLLLLLCFSLFAFIMYKHLQDTRKPLPPWLSET